MSYFKIILINDINWFSEVACKSTLNNKNTFLQLKIINN